MRSVRFTGILRARTQRMGTRMERRTFFGVVGALLFGPVLVPKAVPSPLVRKGDWVSADVDGLPVIMIEYDDGTFARMGDDGTFS